MRNPFRRNMITRASIKESIDNLPTGVCFVDRRGVVVLQNRSMSSIASAVTGTDLQDAEAFWRTVSAGGLAAGVTRLPYENAPTLRLADGSVKSFSRRTLETNGEKFTQILATDITELEDARIKLSEANGRLKAMNERLRRYGKDVIEVTAREERLAAKVRLHDELGGTLLATRHYLAAGSGDVAPILEKWRRDLLLLRGSAEIIPKTSATMLQDAARTLGAELKIEGELPHEKNAEALLLAAISEALNNAVRHAAAKTLRVRISRSGGILTAVITNDGALPESVPAEGGGLSELRRSVEGAGGTLEIATEDMFTLRITIPMRGAAEA